MSGKDLKKSSESTLIATDLVIPSATNEAEESKTKKKADPLDELNAQFEEICQEVATIRTSIGSVMSKLRQYKKKVDKALKDNQKGKKKKSAKSETKPKRSPSGITMPTQIAPILCDFLGKPHDTQMARTAITKEIYAYIRENRLQDQGNKQRINPDDKLKKLLDLEDNDELNYFNLQTHLSKHFNGNKTTKSTVTASDQS